MEPEEKEEKPEEKGEEKIVMMADSGNWTDPSTLEKSYQTIYERPKGMLAMIGKSIGFLVFVLLFAVGVLKAVPSLFRFILGIPETK